MNTLLKTTILLAAIAASPCHAQTPQVNVFGFEDSTCTAWLKTSANKAIRLQYEFWIRGFVSGHNYGDQSRQVAVGGFPGGETLYQFLDQYCKDNPKASFIGGAISLVEQLRQAVVTTKPATTRPAPVPAPGPATQQNPKK